MQYNGICFSILDHVRCLFDKNEHIRHTGTFQKILLRALGGNRPTTAPMESAFDLEVDIIKHIERVIPESR